MDEKLDTRLAEAPPASAPDECAAVAMTPEVRAAVVEDIRISRQELRQGKVVRGQELEATLDRFRK